MNSAGPLEIAWRYTQYFDMVRANTQALLDEVYRIRYQVIALNTRSRMRRSMSTAANATRTTIAQFTHY